MRTMSACCLRDSLKLSEEVAVIEGAQRSVVIMRAEEGRCKSNIKNKCGPGQPPKPHCYRGRSDCCLSPRRKIQRSSRNRAPDSYERRAPRIDDHLKLTLQSYDSAFSILLERRKRRRPQSPGTS